MKYKTIPLSIIIGEAFEEVGLFAEEFNMAILKRQASDILRECSTTEQLVHKIVLLETDKMGKFKAPEDLKNIDQVSYRIKKDKHDCTSRERVKEWVQSAYNCAEENFQVKIEVLGDECVDGNCASLPIVIESDFIHQKANPWAYYQGKMGVSRNSTDDINRNSSYLTDKFQLLAYSGNSYFRLQYHDLSCENLSCIGCKYHYSFEWPYVLTDLPPDTEILMSYLAEVTDEKGDLMIPDEINTLEAVKEGLMARHFKIRFIETSDKKYEYLWKDSDARYNAAIGRAKSVLGSPEYQKFRTFLSETWTKRVRNTGEVGGISGRDPYQTHLK